MKNIINLIAFNQGAVLYKISVLTMSRHERNNSISASERCDVICSGWNISGLFIQASSKIAKSLILQ